MTGPYAAEAARAAEVWGADRVYPDGSFMFACHLFGYLDLAARLGRGTRVLDVACGEGYGAAVLAERGSVAIALDLERGLLAESARRYPAARFVAGDGLRLPFGDQAFDAVGALQVIEHLPAEATERFVAEIARVLRPDGFAYVTTPNVDRLPRTAHKEFNPHHLRDFTPAELRAALEAGFGEVRLYGQMLDETLPRAQRLLAEVEREWALVPKIERVEAAVHRLPGPLRVRLRRWLYRAAGVPAWPLPGAEAARGEIRAEDFRAVEPAHASGCTIAICAQPR